MNIKNIILLVLILIPGVVSAKLDTTTRSRMMQDAAQAFQTGNYEEARKIYYDIYVEDGDESSKSLLDKCRQCKALLTEATSAESNGKYDKAIERYQAVISLNPSDNKIPALISQCKKKIYAPKLQLAKQCYREGKYIEARDNLYEYTSLSGSTDTELLTAITEGITWSNEAKLAFDNKDYKLARSYYDRLLAVNPTDAVSLQAVSEINRLTQKTVYIDKSNYKNRKQVNGTALAYSIIPGLGLIQKGHTAEGVTYMVGDVALLGAGIGFNSHASSQKKIMNDRNTGIDEYNKAKSSYNSSRTASYICFGTAAGLYIINLIRSYVATPKPGARLQWSISPEISHDKTMSRINPLSVNMTLSYKF